MIKVAIIGRPNVGKSTLFNKLTKRNIAIVHDSSGTTRDVKEYIVKCYDGFEFALLDTAGLEKAPEGSIANRMTEKTLNAIKVADIIFFVIDGKTSVLPEDMDFAKVVKKYNKDVILVVNKSENMNNFKNNLGDFYRLGFGDPLPLSAEHGQGMINLIERLKSEIAKKEEVEAKEEAGEILDDDELNEILEAEGEMEDGEEEKDFRVRIAIIGRPNVGKSTLVNTLLGEDKMLTGNEAGLTRDSVDTDFTYKGRDVKLIDTAGLRKKNKIYA